MNDMDELVAWIREQLDEDERVAREAGAGRWSWSHGYGDMCNDKECPYGQLVSEDEEAVTVLMDVHGYDVHEGWEGAAHIALHDPARVLREVEAKRLILDHLAYELADHGADNPWWYADRLTPILQMLALPYSDRPGYRSEWAPDTPSVNPA